MKENELPKFVKIETTALRLRNGVYFRDGGAWSIGYKIVDGKLFSHCPDYIQLHNVPLIETTKEYWEDSNGRYAHNDI